MRLVGKSILVCSFVFLVVNPVWAQKKSLNFDVENLKRAAEVIKQNRILFENKELLEQYKKILQDLNKSKSTRAVAK